MRFYHKGCVRVLGFGLLDCFEPEMITKKASIGRQTKVPFQWLEKF